MAHLGRHPVRFAVLSLLGLLVFAAWIRPPVIDGSLRGLLTGDATRFDAQARIERALGGQESAVLIVTPGAVSIADAFAALAPLRAELDALGPGIDVVSIDGAADTLFVWGLDGSAPVVQLLDRLAATDDGKWLVSSGRDRFLVIVESPADLSVNVVDLLRDAPMAGFADVRLLAEQQLEADVAASLGHDLRILTPGIVLVLLLVLWLAFREAAALLLPLYASIASTVVLFALLGLLNISINLVTLLALPLVLIVGLANSCHFLARSAAEQVERADKRDMEDAVIAAMIRVGPPFFLSSMTTAAALSALSFNSVAAIAQLGLVAALALMAGFVLILLMAPLALGRYLARPGRWQDGNWPFAPVSLWLARHRRGVAGLLVLVGLAGAVATSSLSVRSDPRALFPDGAPFQTLAADFEASFYLFAPLRVLVESPSEPLAGLRQAGEIREQLKGLGSVVAVRVDAAGSDGGAFLITAVLDNDEGLRSARRLLDQKAAELAVSQAPASLVFSSATLAYQKLDSALSRSLMFSLLGSALLIFGTIGIVFRSLRATLAALTSSLVPLLGIVLVVVVSGLTLNVVTVFVFLVALGVIVDDAIHILFWRRAGDPLSGSSIEFSVFFSTALLVLGLLLCLLSDFQSTRQFALLCSAALAAAVVSNLTLLPALLKPVSPVAPALPEATDTQQSQR